MTLTGAQGIKELRDQGRIAWDGDIRGDALLLRLGGPVMELVDPGMPINPLTPGDPARGAGAVEAHWDTRLLNSKQLLLAQAMEPLGLDTGLLGFIGTLSHVARLGVMAHLASPIVEGGWSGHITLELFNAGPASVVLTKGMPIAKLLIVSVAGSGGAHSSHGYGQLGDLVSGYDNEFGRG